MKRRGKLVFFLINLIFGAYLINYGFSFIQIPEIISNLDKWIILLGGVLIVIGGINFYRAGKGLSY